MCERLIFFIALVLVLSSAGSAVTIHWTGGAADNLWSNPANWQFNSVPTGADEAWIDAPAAVAPGGPVIEDGINARASLLACESRGEPTLTMTGGSLELTGWGAWWGDGPDCYATFNMSGGTVDFTGSPGVFEFGWGGGAGTLTMTGGTVNAKGIQLPTDSGPYGHIFLHGGTINLGTTRGGLNMEPTGLIDMTEGTLVLEEDQRERINGFIAAGQMTAYSGAGYFEVDYNIRNPGMTTVTAVPISGRAYNPYPPNGATDVVPTVTLAWSPGKDVTSHKIYFGDNFADVNDGTAFIREQTETSYTPGILDLGQTYHWRIDEVNIDGSVGEGMVWSFTVAGYLLVDDFEDYNDYSPDRVFDTWPGGYTADDQENNGSIVGHLSPPFAEQTVIHGGKQSIPVKYDNSGPANISEAIADIDGLKCGRDWTVQGVKALSLWFRGYPDYVGSFAAGAGGSYTMTGGGAGIAGTADGFHFAFKEVSGASTIVAKVDSISSTNGWAKAGVMIRDALDPNSPHAMICITPDNGLLLQHRNRVGDGTVTDIQRAGVTAPQWVQLQRTVGGLIRAFYSADGSTWIPLGIIATVRVNLPVHVGLAVTSSNINATCVAEFSNVSFPNTSAPGQWTNRDIGIISNEPEPMYVALSNSNGTTGEVYHDDPNATLVTTWTEWNIDLKDFSDQGVDLSDVDKVIIGFGNRDAPQPGGTGMMYFDDIRLYPPRCVLDEITPLEADFTDDCIVDYADVQMMAADWLEADYSDTGTLVLHWAFNDGPPSTTASDASGNNRAGAVSGATWVSPGQDGTSYCLDFMGSGQDVNHPDAGAFMNGLHGLTVSVWVNSELSDTDRGIIIFSEPDGTDNRDLRYDAEGSMSGRANVIKCGITSTDGIHEIESSADMQVMGQWQHLAMTWQRYDPVKLYINGQLDDSSTDQPLRGGTLTGYDRVLVGKGGKDEDPDMGWDGRIDDVRIYNYALTADQVATVMAGGSLPEVSMYYELISPAELYGAEEPGFKAVNFKDLAILADQWQEKRFWPEW
jgi:hypothetical protein